VATSHIGPVLMLRGDRYAALIDPRRGADAASYFDLTADPGERQPLDAAAVGAAATELDAHAKAWFAAYLAVVGADSGADDGSMIDDHHHMDTDLRDQLRSLGYAK
jgi:hypothetical protein